MDLLHCSALSPHADVEQLSTTVAAHCCRAINHPQSGQAQTEQPPLGMDKRTEREAGQEMEGGSVAEEGMNS